MLGAIICAIIIIKINNKLTFNLAQFGVLEKDRGCLIFILYHLLDSFNILKHLLDSFNILYPLLNSFNILYHLQDSFNACIQST